MEETIFIINKGWYNFMEFRDMRERIYKYFWSSRSTYSLDIANSADVKVEIGAFDTFRRKRLYTFGCTYLLFLIMEFSAQISR